MSGLQSILGRAAGKTPTTDAELRKMAAAAWHQGGVICLRAEWIIGWGDKELAAAIATKVHGKRKVGN